MKFRVMSAVLLVSLLFVGCGPKLEEEATPTPIPTSVVPEKPTYVVARGTVEHLEQFSARVSPVEEQDLYFLKGGYVKVVYVDKGDWVEAGTVLAELELDDLLSQLNLAQVDLDSAQKQYAAAEEAHQRKVYSAKMSLEVAQLRLERLKAQAPTADFTSLKFAQNRAADALEEARIAYKEALDRPWEPQRVRDSLLKNIARAEESLTEAQVRYQQAVHQYEQSKVVYDLDLKLQEMEVQRTQQELDWLEEGLDPSLSQGLESAKLKMDRLQAQVETAQLIAPFGGEVTSISAVPGRAVEAHKAVAVIANPDQVDITSSPTSDQMSLLEEGQEVEVTTTKEPGKIFKAIIAQLPYPYGSGGGEAKVEDQDQRVHIQLLNPAELELEVGDLVKVTVLIERSEDALYLPPAAIRTFEGRRFVMVKENDRLRKVDIKPGIEGEDRIEILSGLEEGQVIEGL